MIIITVKKLEDFRAFFLNNRATNHLFYELRQNENEPGSRRLIYFNFLGVLGTLNVVYQHVAEVPPKVELEALINQLKSSIAVDGVSYVEGTIREIFLSIS